MVEGREKEKVTGIKKNEGKGSEKRGERKKIREGNGEGQMRGKEKRGEERKGREGRERQHLRIPSSPALLIPTWFHILSLGFTSLFLVQLILVSIRHS